MNQEKILGIDVGGSFVKCGIVLPDGAITMPLRFSTASLLDTESRQTFLAGPIRTYTEAFPELRKIGIGLPGYLSADRREVLLLPNITAAYPIPLVANLGKIFPELDIRIENDANCAALGEYIFGAAAGKDCLFITMGTGIGSGAIIGGRLFRGGNGNAMELGHMLHTPDTTVEEAIGKKGILAYAAQTGNNTGYTPDTGDHSFSGLLEQAARGEHTALRVFDYVARVLGQMLHNAIQVLDIGNIYIGGGISVAFDFIYPVLQESLTRTLQQYYLGNYVIARASLGNEAGLLGAALLHHNHQVSGPW